MFTCLLAPFQCHAVPLWSNFAPLVELGPLAVELGPLAVAAGPLLAEPGFPWLNLAPLGRTWSNLAPLPYLHISFVVFRFVSLRAIFLRLICHICLSVVYLSIKLEACRIKDFYIFLIFSCFWVDRKSVV